MTETSDRLVRLVLRDPSGQAGRLELDFRLFATPIAQRWGELVAFLDQHRAQVTSPQRFYNFANDPKQDPAWIRGELQRCISGIHHWSPGFVDMKLEPELTQKTMNELHEYFVDGADELENRRALERLLSGETLGAVGEVAVDRGQWRSFLDAVAQHTGKNAESMNIFGVIDALEGHPQFGAIMRGLYVAFSPAQPYLEQLNQAIHRWEDQVAVRACEAAGGEGWKYLVANFFPSLPLSLKAADYRQFTIRDVFGRVYLDDISAGKCIWDVFRDQDEQIVGDHYKNLHRFWGDSRFYFGPTHSEREVEERLAAFWKWFDENESFLEKAGFRRGDPEMTIGRLPVADLERRGAVAGASPREIVDLISRFQHIERLQLVDESGRVIESNAAGRGSWREVFAEHLESIGRLDVQANAAG